MRQFRTYGSVRGAAGNRWPYRDPLFAICAQSAPEISTVLGAVKQGLMAEHKVAVAEWLKARMHGEKGQWKETSQAKKPDKDREYQNTLLVMKWLQGE